MTFSQLGSLVRSALVFAVMAISYSTQAASYIYWHNSSLDILLKSDGSDLSSDFRLELGYFSSSFTPTASNTSEWSTYWRPWDLLAAGAGFNSTNGFYASSKTFTGVSTASVVSDYGQSFSIPTGSQAYMWVFNSKAHIQGTEWALVTNTNSDGNLTPAWLFPNPNADSADFGPEWQLLDVGTVVLGGVEDVQGPGTFSSNPAAFALQTSAIPEPGAALLIFAIGIVAQIRRHRRIG